MNKFTASDIAQLSISERILLVEDVWDSIAEVPDELTLSAEQKAELDRRLEAYRKNPDLGSPWQEVKHRLLKR